MKPLLAALLIASPAFAQEDAAHRADRLRTQALNRGVSDATAANARMNAQAVARYRAARAAYAREMDDWRRQTDACRRGETAMC